MILHQYYQDDKNNKVYLQDTTSSQCFYRIGQELVVATIEFFTGKYKLIK